MPEAASNWISTRFLHGNEPIIIQRYWKKNRFFEADCGAYFSHNRLTIMKRNLGLEIERPEQIDELVSESWKCVPAIKSLNVELMDEFGTLDGIGYIAEKVRIAGL